VLDRDIKDHHCPLPGRAAASLSLLRIANRIIVGVHVCVYYAGCRTRVVGGGSPHALQQFHVPEFVERDATPVIRGSNRTQPAFAFPAKLVTKNPTLPLLVSSESVRAKQTRMIVVNSRDGSSAHHGRAHDPENILPSSRAPRPGIAHNPYRLPG
jgi:hypothetical protein